ncbi:T-complex protein 11-like protein 2 [Pseudocercospora fuligena]|uniref:T-complex protein 11-like protein 2 n=1 Tax=Pseudocercospora fuligena TaxID=685502 RepID=A0A8H6R8J9_9PEZI|nr:T-complex protein 11-like protein 2 [Pseudocercospora fuligena]
MNENDTMSQAGDHQDILNDETIDWESSLNLDSDDASQQTTFYAPPAHIAARFYRNQRRKSSAASSRRNSLSSAQSHTSGRSSRRNSYGGCQSTYVAQHLRRASIIESRKARLADRAAHAEQVRLRAALAKAAPRGSTTSSEERALAAQVAKEKYLAKVAAACAEEVARAKRIAEQVKERKLAEETRVRMEMEERHAEAEKRRAEYQRNLQARRARRADSAEKKLAVLEEVADIEEEALIEEIEDVKLLDESAAAKRIQDAWRLHMRSKPVRAFRQCYVIADRFRNSTFEEMTAFVADTEVIDATTAILTHLGLQDENDVNAALNTRTFLSAYMIIGHPTSVLINKTGAQESDLIAKATELVGQFESSVARLASWNNYTANPIQLEALSQMYTAYTSAFAAWRLQDSSVLIEGMVASFVELDAIWQTVKDDSRGEVASDYREGIRDNQVMLLSRIRKLAGPERADRLIKKAIGESRRRRPKRRPAAEVRPRGVEAITPEAAASSEQAVEEAALPTTALGSGELNRLFTSMPSNRVLTHELAIDKDFKLEDKHSELRDHLYRSICESMKAGFEAGNSALWTVSAAENVREKLLRMLKPGNNMHSMISEALDLENINRQCQQGVFSYSGFFSFMANVLPKLCAPFRDQEVKVLAEELRSEENGDELGVMIEKLFKLLRMVDSLSLDYTNFMIMNAAPTLIKEAAGYEQRQFGKDLEAHTITLTQTRRWWQQAQATLSAEADRRDPDGIRNPADRPSPQAIYTHALVESTVSQAEIDADLLPETLHLDLERLRKIRAKAIRIAVIGAVFLTTKNLLKRDTRSQWKVQANRLWTLLSNEPYETTEEPTTAQKAFSVLETAHNMPDATKQAVASTIRRFFAQAAQVSAGRASFTDPVLKVLFQRLKIHIMSRLMAVTSADRVRAASSASEKLASSGMAEFVPHVATIVDTLERVRKVDWEGHGTWYERISQEGMSDEQSDDR